MRGRSMDRPPPCSCCPHPLKYHLKACDERGIFAFACCASCPCVAHLYLEGTSKEAENPCRIPLNQEATQEKLDAPPVPGGSLQQQLEEALRREDYEEAARIRDQLRGREHGA